MSNKNLMESLLLIMIYDNYSQYLFAISVIFIVLFFSKCVKHNFDPIFFKIDNALCDFRNFLTMRKKISKSPFIYLLLMKNYKSHLNEIF